MLRTDVKLDISLIYFSLLDFSPGCLRYMYITKSYNDLLKIAYITVKLCVSL